MKVLLNGAVMVALLVGIPAASFAQTTTSATAQALSKGVVKKIDAAQGKMTVAHGPLANLNMPAMTMLFRVSDPAMLSAVKPGDDICFNAEKINGALTITRLEPASASGVSSGVTAKPAMLTSLSFASSGAAASMSAGVVQEVDVGQGEITIDHGPLANLQMPAMSMVFRVANATLLNNVKAGDNISFMAEKANGELTVTQLKQTKATSGSVVAPVPAQPIAAARTQVSATTPARTYASNGTLSAGTVKKVDPDQGKITISHGPLANLSMPAMTMVFDLADRAMIGKVKAGDSIEFTAEKVNGALTITQLESGKAVTTPDQRPGPQSATTLPRSPNVVGRNLDPVSGQAAKAHSMPTSRSGTPDAPTQTNTGVGAPPYQSPFSNYQMMQEIADAPGAVWRAANDEVARLGGHVGQLREKSASALDDTPAKPAVGMAVVPGGAPAVHDMTKLKKDK